MTLLRIRVTTTSSDKAKALLFHLEDVVASPHSKGTVDDKMVVMDVDERDIPAVKQAINYYRSWIK